MTKPLINTARAFSLALAFTACTPEVIDDSDDTDVVDVNKSPIAVDDQASTKTQEPVELWLTVNDSDPNEDELIVSAIVQPDNGFVEILSGEERIEYTSSADFIGIDSFEYTVSDQQGGTDQGEVTINVEELPPDPTIVITSPADGQDVDGTDVQIEFQVDGCNVSSPSQDADGCHIHNYLDGALFQDDPSHYSDAPFTISIAEPGSYVFTLVLAVNTGSDANMDPEISDSVTFEVE